jgi:hypothetical protein
MKEIIIIKTSESEKIKNFLQQVGVNYEIYQEPPISSFAYYGQASQDPEREQEAQNLENAEAEDIINEE